MKDFCPFIKGKCNDDCVFKCANTATEHGISDCLLAVKLDAINEYQTDQLSEIENAVLQG